VRDIALRLMDLPLPEAGEPETPPPFTVARG
jgi:hypothetical protein